MKIKSKSDDLDIKDRFGSAIILPFLAALGVMSVVKIFFKLLKPKSTLKQAKDKKK